MRLAIPLLLCVLAAPALADSMPTVVETYGIEIEIPTGWSVTNKGALTIIAPTKYKGRGIEIVEISKPLSKDLLLEFMKDAHVDGAEAKEGERNGGKAVFGTGKMVVKDLK